MTGQKIVSITDSDIAVVTEFLQNENMPITAQQLTYLLNKNPQLSQMVVSEGKVIGSVLCSFDGLKAYLNKLVVNADYRQQGWGQKLITAVVKQLEALNCPELVINCKPFLEKWYAKQGFIKQDGSYYVLPIAKIEANTLSCG